MIIEESKILKKKLSKIIEMKNFEQNFKMIEINNDEPFTFSKKDYNVKEGTPFYTNSNKFGKSGTAIAVISKNTIAIYTSEHITYPKPIKRQEN